jgi:6-phosphogluconate dehydrogenase
MIKGLGMNNDEIGDEFQRWNDSGELKGTFLIDISAKICKTIDPKTGERVLDTVEDKVVQDVSGEEGTGVWSNEEAIAQHIPAPTLTVAHYLRLASSDLAQRRKVNKVFGGDIPPQKVEGVERKDFLESLRLATYTACLASYVQGMIIIERADQEKHFNINYNDVLQIWSNGCIIRADFITENLLHPIYKDYASKESLNPLYEPAVADEFKKGLPSLKKVCLKAMEGDHNIPALSASLEWLKIMTSVDLPTSFYEAQLDYFGNHMFDKRGDDPEGLAVTGKHSYEWKSA